MEEIETTGEDRSTRLIRGKGIEDVEEK